MKYKNLTDTIQVSEICLGTMTWGRQNNQADAFAQMDYAIENGVNFFDTAEMYPVPPNRETYAETERIIGRWLKDRTKPENLVIATKIAGKGLRWIRGGEEGITAESVETALNGSLERLNLDCIDLYQLHWPNRPFYHFGKHWYFDASKTDKNQAAENIHLVVEKLTSLRKEGKIKCYGLSNESSWGTMQYIRTAEIYGLDRPVSIQNEYSLLNRLFEPDLAEVSILEKTGLLAWSPLATGMLTGKYRDGKKPAGSRWTMLGRHNQRDTPQAHAAVYDYVSLAKEAGMDPAQLALAFVNSRPFVLSNIIGATNMDQLKTNIASAEIELTEDILKKIDEIRRDYPVPF